jgi:hypothetical protein
MSRLRGKVAGVGRRLGQPAARRFTAGSVRHHRHSVYITDAASKAALYYLTRNIAAQFGKHIRSPTVGTRDDVAGIISHSPLYAEAHAAMNGGQ